MDFSKQAGVCSEHWSWVVYNQRATRVRRSEYEYDSFVPVDLRCGNRV